MKEITGKNLRLFREANQFTQEQVAKLLDIGCSAYANYEAGIREMPVDMLEKAADLFGCELYLMFEDNPKTRKEMLSCAFRIENASDSDLEGIAHFKKIAKNYLKMNQLINK